MLTELDAKGWELYNLNEDFAETKNLAEKEKARLIAMIGMWYNEAGKYNVLPIDSRGLQRIAEERPQIAVNRNALRALSRHPVDTSGRRAENPQPALYHHGGGGHSQGGRRRSLAQHGRQRRRHLVLRAGRQALLRSQLRRGRTTTT